MEMNRIALIIALIISVVALFVSFTIWAIDSSSYDYDYDHGKPYLNDVGATINTSSKTAQHERYYVNDSVHVGIGYTNEQPSSKLIINSDVGIGDEMKEMKAIKIKDIIDTIKTNNPYPVDIFAEPTREEYIKVQKLFKDAGLVQDKFFAAYGRKVWNNCIANIEKEVNNNETY